MTHAGKKHYRRYNTLYSAGYLDDDPDYLEPPMPELPQINPFPDLPTELQTSLINEMHANGFISEQSISDSIDLAVKIDTIVEEIEQGELDKVPELDHNDPNVKQMIIPAPPFVPYPHQAELLKLFAKWIPTDEYIKFNGQSFRRFIHVGCKNMGLEWHRQSGKDATSQIILFLAILHNPLGYYWYMFPTTANLKKAILDDPDKMYRLMPEGFLLPGRRGYRATDNVFTFFNGAKLACLGANNWDGSVGATLHGVVYSEFQNTTPLAMTRLEDTLNKHSGFRLANGTPRGYGHFTGWVDECTENYQRALAGDKDPTLYNKWGNIDWFGSTITNYDTGLLSLLDLQKRFKGLKSLWGADIAENDMLQEVYCSREAGQAFAYFRREMQDVQDEGRIVDLAALGYPHPDYPIHSSWDLSLGRGGDRTVCTVFQVIPDHDYGDNVIYILDYYGNMFENAEVILKNWLWPNYYAKGYKVGYAAMPWDLEWAGTIISDIQGEFYSKFRIPLTQLPRGGKSAKVQRTQMIKKLLPRCIFSTKCMQDREVKDENLINALKNYRGKWDPDNRITTPIHDWSSDYTDSWGYGALSINITYEAPKDPTRQVTDDMRGTPYLDKDDNTFKYYPTKPKR